MRLKQAVIGALVLGLVACGKTPPTLSPEGKAAYYAEKFLSAVEQAQNETIALHTAGTISKPDADAVVRVFVGIFQGGKALADALDVIDQSNVTAEKQTAAQRVDIAMKAFSAALTGITVNVASPTARARIQQVLDGLKLAAQLLDVYRVIGPLLQPGAEPPPIPLARHSLTGGYAIG